MPTIIVELSDDAATRLERLSQRARLSHHDIAERAITSFIDTEEWQLSDIESGLNDARLGNFISEERAGQLFSQLVG